MPLGYMQIMIIKFVNYFFDYYLWRANREADTLPSD